MALSDGNNRITWKLLENKRVSQKWETTQDKGKTWVVVFDGVYLKLPQ